MSHKLLRNKASSMMLLIVSSMMTLTGCGSSSSDGGGGVSGGGGPDTIIPQTGQAGDGRLTEIVEYIRVDAGLPAMAAVLVQDGQIVEMAATGLRSIEGNTPVTIDDKWHLGSLTKSMTSTLAAMLVKQGSLEWSTTIGDVYPELLGTMRTEYETVRLDELLSHTSGMRVNIPTLFDYNNQSTDITQQRQQMIEETLVLAPESTRGEFLYSNLGYMVAGAMMERVTASSWETLMANNLFNTLAMSSSGFGAPDVQGNLSQPVGHTPQGSGWRAITSGNTDNPAVLGPAGTVHSSLEDMGHYIAAHLKGARGNDVDGLLTSAEFNRLHTSMSNVGYALGWGITVNTLEHNGSNTMWLANIVINPNKNMAIFVVTNAADLDKQNSTARNASERLIEQLTKRIDATF